MIPKSLTATRHVLSVGIHHFENRNIDITLTALAFLSVHDSITLLR